MSETTTSTETGAVVDHPAHYNRGEIEVIRAIRAYAPDFSCGNALKYLCRAGSKPGQDTVTDLQKAAWYLRDAMKPREARPDFTKGDFVRDQNIPHEWRFAVLLLLGAGEYSEGHSERERLLGGALAQIEVAIETLERQRAEAQAAAE